MPGHVPGVILSGHIQCGKRRTRAAPRDQPDASSHGASRPGQRAPAAVSPAPVMGVRSARIHMSATCARSTDVARGLAAQLPTVRACVHLAVAIEARFRVGFGRAHVDGETRNLAVSECEEVDNERHLAVVAGAKFDCTRSRLKSAPLGRSGSRGSKAVSSSPLRLRPGVLF